MDSDTRAGLVRCKPISARQAQLAFRINARNGTWIHPAGERERELTLFNAGSFKSARTSAMLQVFGFYGFYVYTGDYPETGRVFLVYIYNIPCQE